jgi:hypothetical protein
MAVKALVEFPSREEANLYCTSLGAEGSRVLAIVQEAATRVFASLAENLEAEAAVLASFSAFRVAILSLSEGFAVMLKTPGYLKFDFFFKDIKSLNIA